LCGRTCTGSCTVGARVACRASARVLQQYVDAVAAVLARIGCTLVDLSAVLTRISSLITIETRAVVLSRSSLRTSGIRSITIIFGTAARVDLHITISAAPAACAVTAVRIGTINTHSTILARAGCAVIYIGDTVGVRVASRARTCAASRRSTSHTVDAVEVAIAAIISSVSGGNTRIGYFAAGARVARRTVGARAAARRAADGASVHAVEVAVTAVIGCSRSGNTRIGIFAAGARPARSTVGARAATCRAADGASVYAVEVAVTAVIGYHTRGDTHVGCCAVGPRIAHRAADARAAARRTSWY
jgi:hypothetical protein